MVFVKNGIEYSIVEKHIVLKPLQQATTPRLEEKIKHKFIISGNIKDKLTGENLIGAIASIKGTNIGSTTNSYGFYSLSLTEGIYKLVFSFIGFKTFEYNLNLKDNSKIFVELEPTSIEMKEVEIKSDISDYEIKKNQISEMKLTPAILSTMPGFVGEVDVIKALQSIPGFKSFGDGSTFFFVRGGNSDQNLLMLDEAPIYNPSHLFGFFTAIAPNAIKDVETYKGDFPVSYGGRLSSVVDIKSKDGNMKKFGCEGSVSLYNLNLSVEGPIIKDNCSFYFSGRKSILWWLNSTSFTKTNISADFFDLNGKINYKINDNNRIYLTLYGGNDVFGRVTVRASGVKWNNVLGSFRWNHIFNNKLFSNTTFYVSQYDYYLLNMFNNIKSSSHYWNSSILNKCGKSDFTYYLNPKNTIKSGVEVNTHFSNPGNFINIEDVPIVQKYNSLEYDLYISNEQELTKKIFLTYGVRFPIWQDLGAITVYNFDVNYRFLDSSIIAKNKIYSTFINPEPRVNLKYIISNSSSLKASFSRTVQYIQMLSNSTSPFTSLEVWLPSGPNIKPQLANQYTFGYFKNLNKNKFNFSAELFYKQMYNQIDYADHANMLSNPLIEGELRFGKGWSYGLETMIQKTEGDFTGWLAYTYSRVYKKINDVNNGNAYPAFQDRPNDICINLSYHKKKRWSFSASWIYQTGAAISIPTGFYYYNGYSVPIYNKKNNDRLPDYHRLDISISYKLSRPEKHCQHSVNLAIYNVYARRNPISINFNKIQYDNSFVVPSNLNGNNDLVPTAISVIGILPSLSYNFKF